MAATGQATITAGRVAEIVDRLNSYAPNHRPATLGIWSWVIRKLPEFDEDKSCDAGRDVDVFALTDGTVIRYDYTAGMWQQGGGSDG